MSSESYHEPYEKLTPLTVDLHRAIQSIKEELDAIDWYQQRVDATEDPELKAILAHNRDEEKEHAAMVLEWLRRRDAKVAEVFETYLFTEGDVTKIEAEAEGRSEAAAAEAPPAPAADAAAQPPTNFTVGDLRRR